VWVVTTTDYSDALGHFAKESLEVQFDVEQMKTNYIPWAKRCGAVAFVEDLLPFLLRKSTEC
jgi:hypothetical protein